MTWSPNIKMDDRKTKLDIDLKCLKNEEHVFLVDMIHILNLKSSKFKDHL